MVPLTDLSLVKCKSIKEVHGGNEDFKIQIANEVDILQTPSSSDVPDNESIDSVKSVNVPLTDLSLVKCKSIKKVHGGNGGFEKDFFYGFMA
ncbi:hypothetical protein QTP88_020723 [Uroleucon formosanum]